MRGRRSHPGLGGLFDSIRDIAETRAQVRRSVDRAQQKWVNQIRRGMVEWQVTQLGMGIIWPQTLVGIE